MDSLLRHHVTQYGAGTPPLIFSHGFGTDQHIWRYVAPAFAAQHQIILFDLVGAGQSAPSAYDSTRYATLQGYAAYLVER